MEPKRIFMTHGFTISQESSVSGWNMPYVHYHDSYELYILESGERIVTVNGNEYKTEKHDVILFNKNVPHTSRGTTPFLGICIHILDMYLDLHFTKHTKHQLIKCFELPYIHLDETEFAKIKEYADSFNENSDKNFIVLADILSILNTASTRAVGHTGKITENTQTKAEEILQYTDENYISIKSVNDICTRFGVSQRYVFKLFKTARSATPKHYINALKLKNACHRLKNGTDTVKSIAAESGFDCYEYFLRLFRKEFACTPSEYRSRKDTL